MKYTGNRKRALGHGLLLLRALATASLVTLSAETRGACQLDDFVPGPGHIATELEVTSAVNLCSGWQLNAEVFVDDMEVGWVSDLTAHLLPPVSLAELGFGDVSANDIPSVQLAVQFAYGLLHPGADYVFIGATDDCELAGDYLTSLSLSGRGERLSRSRCGSAAPLAMSVMGSGGSVGDFAVGVRFTGNRFLRHVAISTINNVNLRIMHGWLTFYPPTDAAAHVGFYPRQYGHFFFQQGRLKNELPAYQDNWNSRISFPVTEPQWQALLDELIAVDASPPNFNLVGRTTAADQSTNCMDVAGRILAAGNVPIPSMASFLLNGTADPLSFQHRLEQLGDGSFFNCGRVEIRQALAEPAELVGVPLYDTGPEWMATLASIPAGGPSFWPTELPVTTLPGGSPPPIPVAPGATITLTVNSDSADAAVTAYNGVDFMEIVRPGETMTFTVQNPFAERLAGAIIGPGGVQTYEFLFFVSLGPSGPTDFVLEAPSLPPVMPIVEPGLEQLPDAGTCIHDCDADGIADCDSSPDCNGNGTPDLCDLLIGSSQDADSNGIPDDCECVPASYCDTSPHSAGDGASMSFVGTTSVSQNDLALIADNCPPEKSGIFYYGTAQGLFPFGDGWRCVAGMTFRLSLVNTGPQGRAVFPLNYGSPPQPAGQITPGSTWYFQFWFRDPMGPGGSGFNLSDGLAIEFCP